MDQNDGQDAETTEYLEELFAPHGRERKRRVRDSRGGGLHDGEVDRELLHGVGPSKLDGAAGVGQRREIAPSRVNN